MKPEAPSANRPVNQLVAVDALARYLDANPNQRLGQAVYNIARRAFKRWTPEASDVRSMPDARFVEAVDLLLRGSIDEMLPDDDRAIGQDDHATVYRTTGRVDTVRVENGADVGVIEVGDDGGDWVRLTVSRTDALRLASHWSEELEVIVRCKGSAR